EKRCRAEYQTPFLQALASLLFHNCRLRRVAFARSARQGRLGTRDASRFWNHLGEKSPSCTRAVSGLLPVDGQLRRKSASRSGSLWTYIRWLGDRREIEAQTMTWDKVVVDRSSELSSWVDFCYQIMKRGVLTYAYANNHFQGHGPATIAKFLEIWNAKGFGKVRLPTPIKGQQATLF